MLYWIQLINTEDMETVEISRISSSIERIVKDMEAVSKCYNSHGYDIDKIRIFDMNKELLLSYNL